MQCYAGSCTIGILVAEFEVLRVHTRYRSVSLTIESRLISHKCNLLTVSQLFKKNFIVELKKRVLREYLDNTQAFISYCHDKLPDKIKSTIRNIRTLQYMFGQWPKSHVSICCISCMLKLFFLHEGNIDSELKNEMVKLHRRMSPVGQLRNPVSRLFFFFS